MKIKFHLLEAGCFSCLIILEISLILYSTPTFSSVHLFFIFLDSVPFYFNILPVWLILFYRPVCDSLFYQISEDFILID